MEILAELGMYCITGAEYNVSDEPDRMKESLTDNFRLIEQHVAEKSLGFSVTCRSRLDCFPLDSLV